VARAQVTVFGVDAYPGLVDKAAALLQSLARNCALVDGNKRLAWAAAWTFLYINGIELAVDYDVDRAEDLMNEVATTHCDLIYVAAGAGGGVERPTERVPQPLELQSGLWREVVCSRAFLAAHQTGCTVRLICALMIAQQGVALGEGLTQVVGEQVGV
jgi:death-on-curing protein